MDNNYDDVAANEVNLSDKDINDTDLGKKYIKKVVRSIINSASLSQIEVAEVVGKDVRTFRNKMSSGVFTIEELAVIAAMCNRELVIQSKNHANIYFSPRQLCDNDMFDRYLHWKQSKRTRQFSEIAKTDPDIIFEFLENNPIMLEKVSSLLERKKQYTELLSPKEDPTE